MAVWVVKPQREENKRKNKQGRERRRHGKERHRSCSPYPSVWPLPGLRPWLDQAWTGAVAQPTARPVGSTQEIFVEWMSEWVALEHWRNIGTQRLSLHSSFSQLRVIKEVHWPLWSSGNTNLCAASLVGVQGARDGLVGTRREKTPDGAATRYWVLRRTLHIVLLIFTTNQGAKMTSQLYRWGNWGQGT